jgi:hypothetical protein
MLKKTKRLFRIYASAAALSLYLRAFGSLAGYYQQLTPFPLTGVSYEPENITWKIGAGYPPVQATMPGPKPEYSATASVNSVAPVVWTMFKE